MEVTAQNLYDWLIVNWAHKANFRESFEDPADSPTHFRFLIHLNRSNKKVWYWNGDVWREFGDGGGIAPQEDQIFEAEAVEAIQKGQAISINNLGKAILVSNESGKDIWGFAIEDVLPEYSCKFKRTGSLTKTDLIKGATYFLSNIAGEITNIPPTTGYLIEVGKVINSTILMIDIKRKIKL